MKHHSAQFDANDGLDIFYQYWLPDQRPRAVILISHGLGEHSGRYGNYIDYFVPRGYAFFALDTRGCGRSEGPRGHVDRFADYVDDLRQLHDLARLVESSGKVIVLGHSFGSLIALTYGLRYPDGLAGVIASGTALRDALPYPNWVRAVIRRAGRVLPTVSMPSGLKPEDISRDENVVTAYKSDPLVHSVGTLRWASEAIVARKWIMRRAKEWSLPLLLLHGGADRVCLLPGARQLRDAIGSDRVELRVYEGMYHEVHNEIGKEAVFKDIEDWLQGRL